MASSLPAAPRWYFWFKAFVLGLLAANAAVYVLAGTASEALDSAAWFLLLVSFELETGVAGWVARGRAVLRVLRLAAAAAILAAGVGYVRDGEWLDAANIALWIAVVSLLEFEVRYPAAVANNRAPRIAVAALLYSGLAAMVVAWLWQGKWFDAYDAALWLVAFVTIEINVLGIAHAAAAQHEAGA
jgi:hypothetical protein